MRSLDFSVKIVPRFGGFFMRRGLGLVVLFVFGVTLSVFGQQTDIEKLRQRIQKQVGSVLTALCKILDWKKSRDVPAEVLTRDQLEKMMIEQFKEEMRPGELEKIVAVMTKFGVWRKEWDFMKLMLSMLRKNVAGMYAPKKRRFYVMSDLARGPQLTAVVAHELVHALQDQNFNLIAFERSIYANDDRSLAAHALVEGQATLIGVEYLNYIRTGKIAIEQGRRISPLLRFSFAMQRNAMKNTPKILREMLIFPYEAGTAFYEELFETWGETLLVSLPLAPAFHGTDLTS